MCLHNIWSEGEKEEGEEGEKHVRMFDVTSVAFRTLREKKRMADESIGRETDLMYNTVHCQTACTLLWTIHRAGQHTHTKRKERKKSFCNSSGSLLPVSLLQVNISPSLLFFIFFIFVFCLCCLARVTKRVSCFSAPNLIVYRGSRSLPSLFLSLQEIVREREDAALASK